MKTVLLGISEETILNEAEEIIAEELEEKKNQVARVDWNLSEGERIYRQMEGAMLSADKSISGTVAMNYALSKLIANYKLAMQDLDIEVKDYLDNMVDFWEYQLQNGEQYDRCLFNAFTEEVTDNYILELLH